MFGKFWNVWSFISDLFFIGSPKICTGIGELAGKLLHCESFEKNLTYYHTTIMGEPYTFVADFQLKKYRVLTL